MEERDRFGVRLFGNGKSKGVLEKNEPGVWPERYSDGQRLLPVKSPGVTDKSGNRYIRLVRRSECPCYCCSTVTTNEKGR
jgi:hypothetical protein